MKKIALLFTIILSSVAFSQEVGLRFGEFTGNSVGIDAVFDFEGKRVHANASFGTYHFGATAIYDFIHTPIEASNFYYYIGAGATTSLPLKSESSFWLGGTAEAGIEYRFDFPLVVGLDYRPTLYIIRETQLDWGNFGLNVRYVF